LSESAVLRTWDPGVTIPEVESPLDRNDVTAILTGLFDANAKLDEIIYFLGIDDEEEEEESPDS
jgi:hypothetical protein